MAGAEKEPQLAPAIALEHLSRRYGRSYVLQNITLTVRPGRTLVLHGSNGAGKTTLLRVLSTKLRPSSGQGAVFGFDLHKKAHEVRRRAAYLSVFGGVYGALTATENLQLAAKLYGKELDVAPYLQRVGLAHTSNKLTHSFSSGMKKRLGVARLLLSDAPLWLLDEPYAALDEEGRFLIDGLLKEAKALGKTVVMASHELERSAQFADSIVEVKDRSLTLVRQGYAHV